MADRLTTKGGYPMLTEEPEHCAGSLYVTVIALYEARTELQKLASAMYAGDDSPKVLKLALKILKEHGWPHDKQCGDGERNG